MGLLLPRETRDDDDGVWELELTCVEFLSHSYRPGVLRLSGTVT